MTRSRISPPRKPTMHPVTHRLRESNGEYTVMTRSQVRRMAQKPTPSSMLDARENPKPKRLWLDELPLEVCTRVAAYVSRSLRTEPRMRRSERTRRGNHQSYAALCLAEVSEKQRCAVLEALSHKLFLPTHPIRRWAAVFQNGITEVHTDYVDLVKIPNGILNAPSLRFAAISNRPEYLKAISTAPALRELSVDFSDSHSTDLLLDTLRILELTELRLSCYKQDLCIFKNLFKTREEFARLAAVCPNLYGFEVICTCSEAKDADLGPVVGTFPTLRKLAFNVSVPDNALPYLQSLDSVLLKHFSDFKPDMQTQLEYAAAIGDPVASIELDEFSLPWTKLIVRACGVALLAKCPRLSKLDLVLERGAECNFPELRELRSLRLSWFDEENVANPVTIQGVEAHYIPPPVFLSRIMDTAPKLTELCLFNLRISMEKLREILSSIGAQLEVFGTSFLGQAEPLYERFLEVIDAARVCTPSLRRLCMYDSEVLAFEQPPDHVRSQWEGKICRALGFLQRRAPLLDIQDICDDFDWNYVRAPVTKSLFRKYQEAHFPYLSA